LLDGEKFIVAGLIEKLLGAVEPGLAKFRGMSVVGSNGSRLAAAPATVAGSELARPPMAEELAVSLAVAAGFCTDPVVDPVVPVLSPVMVWLMLMSWSSWFSEIIWPTISVESTGAVGSWFCNSVDSRLRKVLPKAVTEVPLELVLALVVELAALVEVRVLAAFLAAAPADGPIELRMVGNV
jgi:hypothetical protein